MLHERDGSMVKAKEDGSDNYAFSPCRYTMMYHSQLHPHSLVVAIFVCCWSSLSAASGLFDDVQVHRPVQRPKVGPSRLEHATVALCNTESNDKNLSVTI